MLKFLSPTACSDYVVSSEYSGSKCDHVSWRILSDSGNVSLVAYTTEWYFFADSSRYRYQPTHVKLDQQYYERDNEYERFFHRLLRESKTLANGLHRPRDSRRVRNDDVLFEDV